MSEEEKRRERRIGKMKMEVSSSELGGLLFCGRERGIGRGRGADFDPQGVFAVSSLIACSLGLIIQQRIASSKSQDRVFRFGRSLPSTTLSLPPSFHLPQILVLGLT